MTDVPMSPVPLQSVPTLPVPMLEVNGLTVEYPIAGEWTPVIQDVSFSVHRGETVGIVGESGSGKTIASLSVLGLVGAQGGRVTSGSIRLDGQELIGCATRTLRKIRGQRVGMIFQQPTRSLDPAFTVGEQIAETVRRHLGLSRREAWKRAVNLLERVHIADAARRARDYPYEFSGGMCQRVMIALAISCGPELLIADEPTTALDVTVQSTILDLLREIQTENGLSVMFISHDLGVIAEMCSRVVIMYAGQVVETGTTNQLFLSPRHPYTEGLLGAIAKVGMSRELRSIPGTMSSPGMHPKGCRFAPRCGYAIAACADEQIESVIDDSGRMARCGRIDTLDLTGVAPR